MAVTAEPLDLEEEAAQRARRRHPGRDRPAARRRPGGRRSQPRTLARTRERAYAAAADWRDFCAFVARIGRGRLPAEPETVALYVAGLKRRGRRPATIARKLAAIAVYHRSLDRPTPTDHDVVRAVVRGTRRQLGVARPSRSTRCAPSSYNVPDDLRGLRDRALLLVG
jgi:hypothetical protein